MTLTVYQNCIGFKTKIVYIFLIICKEWTRNKKNPKILLIIGNMNEIMKEIEKEEVTKMKQEKAESILQKETKIKLVTEKGREKENEMWTKKKNEKRIQILDILLSKVFRKNIFKYQRKREYGQLNLTMNQDSMMLFRYLLFILNFNG